MQTVAGSLVYSGQKPTRKRIDSHTEPVSIDRKRAAVSLDTLGCILNLPNREAAFGFVDYQTTHASSRAEI